MARDITIGYMLLAAKELKMDKKAIRRLEKAMQQTIENKTEYDAAEEYMNFI